MFKLRFIITFVMIALVMALGSYLWWRCLTQPRVVDLQTYRDLPAGAVLRTFDWFDPLNGASTSFHVLTMPLDEVRVDIWFHEPGVAPEDAQAIGEVVSQTGAVFAINGGYFEDDFSPSGLAVSDGVSLKAASDAATLSGIMSISEEGAFELTQFNNNATQFWDAIQSGPFLIDPGAKVGIYSDDERSQRRSVIALSGDRQLIVLTADAISLYDLAHLLQERPDLFGAASIDRALNLDGGPSTALFIEGESGGIVVPSAGPVNNYILFRSR